MHKITTLILLSLCFFQSVAQEARVYKENEKWGLLGAQKKRITPAIYDLIIPGIPYSVVKKYNATTARYTVGCINESGEVVIPLVYTDLRLEGLRIIACLKNQHGFVYGVISLQNEVIIPIQYKSIKALGTLRFALENQDGKFALFTEEGVALSDFSIDAILPFNKGYSIFEKNGLVGLLDREGNIQVAARYRELFIQEDGSVLAQKPSQWKWINTQNTVLQSLEADSLMYVADSLLLVKNRKGFALLNPNLVLGSDYYAELTPSELKNIFRAKKQKYGVLNAQGNLLIPCQYDAIHITKKFIYANTSTGWSIFSISGRLLNTRTYEAYREEDEKVWVKKNKHWGVLNEVGKEIIACVYDTILQSKNQQVSVGFKGKYGIISSTETWLVPPQAYPLVLVNDSYYLVSDAGLLTLKDFSNNTQYFTNNKLIPVADGFEELTTSGEVWHVSFTGMVTKLQQNPQGIVSSIEEEHEGYRAIQKDGKWGFVDAQGRLRIPNRYDAVRFFSEGLAPFSLRKKWGFINKEDEIIIHPTYEEARPFQRGFSLIRQKGLYGLLNKENEIILPCRYEGITSLSTGFFELRNKNLYGLADPHGNIVYEPKYQRQSIHNNLILVERNGKYGVLTLNGLDLIPTMYDYLHMSQKSNHFLIMEKGTIEKLIL